MNRRGNTTGGELQEVRTCTPVLERPWLFTILLASGLCVAYLVGVFINWGDAADRLLYANLGLIPIGLAASLLAATAARRGPVGRTQWAWRLLAAGLTCFFVGDLLYFVYQNILATSPFPSVADAGYLVYYPLVFAGLLLLPRGQSTRRYRAWTYVACLLLICAACAVIYAVLLPTVWLGYDDLLTYLLSVGYPAGDLLLLAGLAWVLVRGVAGNRWSTWLLCGGVVVGLAADVHFGYQGIQGSFQAGGFSDAAYMLSWALFAWAGYIQATRTCSGDREAEMPIRTQAPRLHEEGLMH